MGQTQDTNFHTETTRLIYWHWPQDAEKRGDISQRLLIIALGSGGQVRPYADMFGSILGLRIKNQHGYLLVTFLDATGIQQCLGHEGSHLIILHNFSTTNVYLRQQLLQQQRISFQIVVDNWQRIVSFQSHLMKFYFLLFIWLCWVALQYWRLIGRDPNTYFNFALPNVDTIANRLKVWESLFVITLINWSCFKFSELWCSGVRVGLWHQNTEFKSPPRQLFYFSTFAWMIKTDTRQWFVFFYR